MTCQTFEALKKLADFDNALAPEPDQPEADEPDDSTDAGEERTAGNLGLNLAYTINLVLPKTDDPAVFNAIFKALREHLLRR